MKWIKVTEEVPEEFLDVLVETNLYNDDAFDFFVAEYDPIEKEWRQHFNFQPENSPHIWIARKVLKADRWCYIE